LSPQATTTCELHCRPNILPSDYIVFRSPSVQSPVPWGMATWVVVGSGRTGSKWSNSRSWSAGSRRRAGKWGTGSTRDRALWRRPPALSP